MLIAAGTRGTQQADGDVVRQNTDHWHGARRDRDETCRSKGRSAVRIVGRYPASPLTRMRMQAVGALTNSSRIIAKIQDNELQTCDMVTKSGHIGKERVQSHAAIKREAASNRAELVRITPTSSPSPPPALDSLPVAALPPRSKLPFHLFPSCADRLGCVSSVNPSPPVGGVENVTLTTTVVCGEEE